MKSAVVKARHLGLVDYVSTWSRMREFTDTREAHTADELWVVEHPAVYTLGQSGKREHILNAGQIPVVESDRGGQVTYHGPGQIVIYTLIDLRRAGYGIRDLVVRLENAVIETLSVYDLVAFGRRDAPGVYVTASDRQQGMREGAKIAALGLRVRRGCSYHGLALNVNVDLEAFSGINPCGFEGLDVVSMAEMGIQAPHDELVKQLLKSLSAQLID